MSTDKTEVSRRCDREHAQFMEAKSLTGDFSRLYATPGTVQTFPRVKKEVVAESLIEVVANGG